MTEPAGFREIGYVPGRVAPAPRRVRSEMNRGNAFSQYLLSLIMMGGCGGAFGALAVLCVVIGIRFWGTRDAIFLVGAPLFLAGSVAFIWISMKVMARSNRWVELDGETVRARNLYTGREVERSVWEIREITTEVFLVASAATVITEAIHGRVRGFALQFPDLPQPIRVYRPEMEGVSELVEALVAKLSERGRVVPEFIGFDGRPMVRRLIFEPYSPSLS